MSNKIVDIHFGPKTDIEKHDRLLSRAYSGIIQGVQEYGHDVTITRGAEQLDFDNGVIGEIWIPNSVNANIETIRSVGEISLATIGVIRDLGKKIRPRGEYNIPLLNDPKVIEYEDKLKAYDELLFDMQVPTVAMHDVQQALDELHGDTIFMKPANGSGGKNAEAVHRDDVERVMSENPDIRYIGQEFISTNAPFPQGIKGIDIDEHSKLCDTSHRHKELRMFAFFGNNQIKTVPIVRIMKEGNETSDSWIHVDPDTVPEELTDTAQVVFERLSEKTNTPEVYGVVDYVWGSTEHNQDREWMVGELNLWRPAVSRRNAHTAHLHDSAMAEQLVRIARSERGQQ